MTTTSRRLSLKSRTSKNQHTPGKTKGGYCVRPKDCGIAISGNPYKGSGIKGTARNTYDRLWTRYKGAKGNA